MFFGVEIILREFSVDALFTVMLAAMIADITAIPFLGDKPFLSGFPSGIELHHARDYLLVAVLAVVAALMGLAFKTVLYKTEDVCDRVWKGRPEWARPAVGGVALGLLLLAIPQMYGVGYPVMYKATAGQYALWFLALLAFAKIAACSLTIGIGGSGGVFAPSLFMGVTSGMAFGDIVHHLFGPGAGQPALYAVVAMGAVFASAARAPLTSLASVVEMTGDFALTLPVMLAVAIASTISRALSYGTIYTTKLLRRGTDIDRATPWRALADLKIADAMRPFRNGDPGAAVSRPPKPTVKLSIREVPTSVPAKLLPVPLNSTSPGAASAASVTVDPGCETGGRGGTRSRCSCCDQPRSWPRTPGHRGPRCCRAACTSAPDLPRFSKRGPCPVGVRPGRWSARAGVIRTSSSDLSSGQAGTGSARPDQPTMRRASNGGQPRCTNRAI